MKKRQTHHASNACRLTLVLAAIASLFAIAPAHSQTVTIGGFDNIGYVERADAVTLAPSITISGGNSFADSWIEFEITAATAEETLGYATVETANTADGEISIVGTDIFKGNGTAADLIGSVDATYNGEEGAKLRFNFSSPLENAQFTEPVSGGLIPGWTVYNSAYPHTANLTRTQGRALTISGSGPYTITRYVDQTVPGSTGGTVEYSFTTDFNYVYTEGYCGTGSQHEAWGYEGALHPVAGDGGWRTTSSPSFSTTVVDDPDATGGQALRLTSGGHVPSPNQTNPCRYGSSFGPYVESDEFTAKSGDALALDWRAAGTNDDYEVYGFIVNTTTDVHTLLFYGRGNTQAWTTSESTIPADGEYRFLFVCGSYDATGGYWLGADFYIDNIRVLSSVASGDPEAQQLARLVTYHNASCTPSTPREITFRARNSEDNTETATANVNITLVNCPPTLTATASNPNHIQGGAASGLFSSTAITGPEPNDKILELRFTVSGVSDGTHEKITIDGTTIDLVAGSGTTAGNSLGYSVSVTSPVQVILTKDDGVTQTTLQTIIDGMSYSNAAVPLTHGSREVTLTYLKDDGGTDDDGVDVATLDVKSTVSVYGIPEITTAQPIILSGTSATLGGEVVSSNGTTISEHGYVYSTSSNPTTESHEGGAKAELGTGTGTFSSDAAELTIGTTYYVRAYAINQFDTYYGNEISFQTLLQIFQSKSGGDWKTIANWQQSDGTNWFYADNYPGQESTEGTANPMVTIRAGHQMDIDNTSDIIIPNLKIDGNGKLTIKQGGKLTVGEKLQLDESTGAAIVVE